MAERAEGRDVETCAEANIQILKGEGVAVGLHEFAEHGQRWLNRALPADPAQVRLEIEARVTASLGSHLAHPTLALSCADV